MERKKKYILVVDRSGNIELRFGYPFYHKDLLNKGENQNDCLGGGLWTIDTSDMSILLYGSSDDFGTPKKQDLEKAIKGFDEWEHLEWISRNIYNHEVHLSKIIKYYDKRR